MSWDSDKGHWDSIILDINGKFSFKQDYPIYIYVLMKLICLRITKKNRSTILMRGHYEGSEES